MYIRSCITFTNRNDLVPESLEQICVEINKPKSKPFLVSSWYRPPNSKIEIFNLFEEFLKLVDIEDKELITTGDLNCDYYNQIKMRLRLDCWIYLIFIS
jgi:hypothetical protein